MSDRVRAAFRKIEQELAPDVFAAMLTDDVSFQLGNTPALTGKAAVRDGIAEFYGAIRGMHHEFWAVVDQGDYVVVEADVHYTRADGNSVVLPCVTVWRMRGDLIADDRIYMDPTPLF